MKVIYIESKLKNLEINVSKKEISKLPKNIFLAYSIQYKDLAFKIRKQLEKNNIKISKFEQVLGCSKLNNKSNLPILLIGSGKFHASNLYSQSKEIFILDGFSIHQIPSQEIEKINLKKKTALIKFLKAEKIGILVSIKPGQENLEKAIKLKNKLKKQKKQVYIFLSNNIDINQFENFNIDSWINTACSGLSLDNPNIINDSDLPEI